MSFASVEDIKLFLSKETLTPLETMQIDNLLTKVDDIIMNYCGRPGQMLATDYTARAYKGSGSADLNLRLWPLNSVNAVTVDGVDITADIEFDKETGFLEYTTSIFTLDARVKVTCNAGYIKEAIPGDLNYAAAMLTAINFKRITNGLIGISEGKFEQADFKLDTTDLPSMVVRLLERHRIISIY